MSNKPESAVPKTFSPHFRQETSPKGSEEGDRHLRFSTQENSEFKWRKDPGVIGALLIRSKPVLDYHHEFKKKKLDHVTAAEASFKQFLRVWDEEQLKKGFVEAAEGIPVSTGCCGLVPDIDTTIQTTAKSLNQTWAPKINESVLKEKGFKVDLYIWSWSNPSGKAMTYELLIRAFDLQVVEEAAAKHKNAGKAFKKR